MTDEHFIGCGFCQVIFYRLEYFLDPALTVSEASTCHQIQQSLQKRRKEHVGKCFNHDCTIAYRTTQCIDFQENLMMKRSLTYSFTDRQVWSNNISCINEEYITNVKMICRNIHTTQLFVSGIVLDWMLRQSSTQVNFKINRTKDAIVHKFFPTAGIYERNTTHKGILEVQLIG